MSSGQRKTVHLLLVSLRVLFIICCTVRSLQIGAGESLCLFVVLCLREESFHYSAIKHNTNASNYHFLLALMGAVSQYSGSQRPNFLFFMLLCEVFLSLLNGLLALPQ